MNQADHVRVAAVRRWRDQTAHLYGPGGTNRISSAGVQWADDDALLRRIDELEVIVADMVRSAAARLRSPSPDASAPTLSDVTMPTRTAP